MKKIVLISFALAMAVVVRAQQSDTVDLQVDMTNAILGDPTTGHTSCDSSAFNPAVDVVQPMGALVNNWGGSPYSIETVNCGQSFTPSDTTDMVPVTSGSLIYHAVYVFPAEGGQNTEFKYRIDHSWDNDELRNNTVPDCDVQTGNRCIYLPASADSTSITVLSVFNVQGETITTGIATGVKNVNAVKVNSLYPNPASGKASLMYTTNTKGNVQIYLTNLVGQVVKTVFSGTQTIGLHAQSIDVSGLANGIYFLSLKVNDQTVARKFNVMN